MTNIAKVPNVLTDPDVVYHYTSAATLLKIVESESIWATNLQYLNDITESTHCIDALRKRVDTFLARNPSDFGDDLRAALESVESDFEPPYVASFSAVQDSLPLWRSYCPNGGVSIGFKMSALKKSVLTFEPGFTSFPDNKNSFLKQVSYLGPDDFQLQDRILSNCLEQLSLYQTMRNKSTEIPSKYSYSDERFLRLAISRRSCLVKHSGFESEQEIRLIAPSLRFAKSLRLSRTMLKFRCPRTTVIPYLEVLMPSQEENEYFIDSVVIGPTPNPDLTVASIKLLFESKQIDDVTVLASDIRFRDL